MKKLLKVMMVLFLALSLVACGGSDTPADDGGEEEKTIRIGVAHISMYDEWCKLIYDEFEKQAAEYGYEVDIQNAAGDEETQANQIETFITMGYDMIMVDPCSYEGVVATLEKAGDAGIPVIAFDADAAYDKLITQCAQNHEELGVICADYIADYAEANLDGKVAVGMVLDNSGEQTIIRATGFTAELEKRLGAENVEYVFQQDYSSTSSVETAAQIVENNIAKHMDFIWAATDNGAMGAATALETNNVEGTKVISADGWGTESFTKIYEGNPYYTMCIGCSPVEIVKLCLASAKAYFDGKADTLERHQYIDLAVIDAENISFFVENYLDPDYVKTLTKGENVK